MKYTTTLTAITVLALISTTYTTPVKAQGNPGIAQYREITFSGDIKNGQIISLADGVYQPSATPYDQNTYGVVNLTPSLSIDLTNDTSNSYPISQTGHLKVIVSNSNGLISTGDLITTSNIPGVGIKATEPGMVIGQAIEDSQTGDTENHFILVSLNIHNTGSFAGEQDSDFDRMLALFGSVFKFTDPNEYDEPTLAFRYILSSIIMLISVVFGYSNFSKLARSGIEALGRNPLAGKTITFGIIANVLITIAILGTGFLIAYYILTL